MSRCILSKPESDARALCPVCALQHVIRDSTDVVSEIIPIAGDLSDVGGASLDYHAARLRKSDGDVGDGLRLTLNGGAYPLDGIKDEKKRQRAVIDLICNLDREGTEGEYTPEDKYDAEASSTSPKRKSRREDGGEAPKKEEKDKEGDKKDGEKESTHEKQVGDEKAALKFVSYGEDKDDAGLAVLRLTWETKHACAGSLGEPDEDGQASHHWGFFTWMVIM